MIAVGLLDLAAALLAVAQPQSTPSTPTCASGHGPVFQVQVLDLKNRKGTVRVRVFGGDPATYFVRERALVRIQIPTPATDPVILCVPAPGPGPYALDVRHDVNGDDATDRGDGIGVSGNPKLSLWDVLLHHRPPAAAVQVQAGPGVTVVPVHVRYL